MLVLHVLSIVLLNKPNFGDVQVPLISENLHPTQMYYTYISCMVKHNDVREIIKAGKH